MPNPRKAAAQAFLAAGDVHRAAALARWIVEENPDDAEAHRLLGLAMHGTGDLPTARDCLERSVRLDPRSADGHFALGNLLRELDEKGRAELHYRTALRLDPGHVDALNNLGALRRQEGATEEAVALFREALRHRPHFPTAGRNLGIALMALRDYDAALEALQTVLAQDPADGVAHHLVDAIRGRSTSKPPPGYVQSLFDGYASRFDDHLVGVLGYDVPQAMRRAADRMALPQRGQARVLDLGCGTGLVGAAFRNLAGLLVGVDLSPKMLDEARGKTLYDALYLADVVDFVAELDAGVCDLILAAELAIYLGDLGPLFDGVSAALNVDGLFILSVEHLEEGSYVLRPSGRYAHSRACIGEVSDRAGLVVASEEEVALRRAGDGRQSGRLYLLAKAAR